MSKKLSKDYSSIKPGNWKGLPSASVDGGIFDESPKKRPKKKGIYIHGEHSHSPDVFGRTVKYQYGDLPQIENDDEFESGLIKIEELESSGAPPSVSLNDPEPPVELPSSSPSGDENDEDSPVSLNVESIERVVQQLNKHKSSQIDSVREKFRKHNFPDPEVSKKALLRRAQTHTATIGKLLKGKLETSHYYRLARKQQQVSDHDTMSSTEKWNINWEIFYGGYYGIKRQSIIGNMINKQFQKNLRSAAKKNETVSYWTTSAFSTYVLANEIIVRLVMEDMACELDEAITTIQSSIEYGTIVADSVEVEDDVEIEQVSPVAIPNEDDDSEPEGPLLKKPKMTLIDELVNDVR